MSNRILRATTGRKAKPQSKSLPLLEWSPPPALSPAAARLAIRFRLPPHTAALTAHLANIGQEGRNHG